MMRYLPALPLRSRFYRVVIFNIRFFLPAADVQEPSLFHIQWFHFYRGKPGNEENTQEIQNRDTKILFTWAND